MQTQKSLERIFHFHNRPVRTLQLNGEAWFVAADVCAVLGLANPSQAVSYLDDDERCLITNEAWRNNGGMQAVNEAGLFRWCCGVAVPKPKRSGAGSLTRSSRPFAGPVFTKAPLFPPLPASCCSFPGGICSIWRWRPRTNARNCAAW